MYILTKLEILEKKKNIDGAGTLKIVDSIVSHDDDDENDSNYRAVVYVSIVFNLLIHFTNFFSNANTNIRYLGQYARV